MNDIANPGAAPRAVNWPVLILGMIVTGVVALSVHAVMLQGLHVPYPDDGATPAWPRFLNTVGSITGVVVFYALAEARLASRHFIVRCLMVFALYAMMKETARLILMNGVVTTAWIYSLVQALPEVLYDLVVAILVVLATPRLRAVWAKLAGGVAIAALMTFAVKPGLGAAFTPVMKAMEPLSRPELYKVPYDWHVLVPAYLTFAEPVIACMVIATLVWGRLSSVPMRRALQFITLIMFIKGSVFRILLYSFFIKSSLPVAFLSESQFTLETLTLAALTAVVWHVAANYDGKRLSSPSMG